MIEDLPSRLLGLMALGCRLEARDGHIWIEPPAFEDDEWDDAPALARILRKGGVALNNKIYGGVLEALDTIDAALVRAGHNANLREIGDVDGDAEWPPRYFLGKPGVDASRIDVGDAGQGGIY